MKKKMALILTAAAVMGLAGCSGQTAKTETTAASAAETTSEQTKQAKSEAAETTKASAEATKKDVSGKITLYTSQPEEDAQKLIDGFNKKCPDVTVDVFRSGTEEVVSKVLAEQTAGAVQADVLLVADSVTFETLKEQGMLLSYDCLLYTSSSMICSSYMINCAMLFCIISILSLQMPMLFPSLHWYKIPAAL